MNYSFVQTISLTAFHDVMKVLNSLQLDQLRIALKPHVADFNGNVETFENCFFPVYPNNEGGVEQVRFYVVKDGNGSQVFDLVRIDQTAASFFNAGTSFKCLDLWAGRGQESVLQPAETEDLLRAWKGIL